MNEKNKGKNKTTNKQTNELTKNTIEWKEGVKDRCAC